jgi:RHH-type rel operon transcriptional repressor/antitoxin RelB
MLGVRLDKDTEERLDRLARETHRTKSHYVKEAIAQYLAEKEDTLIALARLEKRAPPLTTKEMWKVLGREVSSPKTKRYKTTVKSNETLSGVE